MNQVTFKTYIYLIPHQPMVVEHFLKKKKNDVFSLYLPIQLKKIKKEAITRNNMYKCTIGLDICHNIFTFIVVCLSNMHSLISFYRISYL